MDWQVRHPSAIAKHDWFILASRCSSLIKLITCIIVLLITNPLATADMVSDIELGNYWYLALTYSMECLVNTYSIFGKTLAPISVMTKFILCMQGIQ